MQREIKKYAHGLSSIYVHMSFKIKYCHKVFGNKEFREECQTCFKKTAEEYNINVFSMGFDLNHAIINYVSFLIEFWFDNPSFNILF